tara:strand:- start:2590 stop:3201 length:612 start_codon:yes stop_codon:yes gene_type:complete
MATERIMSLKQKRDIIQQSISLLSRCKAIVTNAEIAYNTGLASGQDVRVLVAQFTSNLATAILVRDDAYELLNTVDLIFPYYIDVISLSKINKDLPEMDFVDLNDPPDGESVSTTDPDEIRIHNHVDALSIFNGDVAHKVLIEDIGGANVNIIALVDSASAHTPASDVSTLLIKKETFVETTSKVLGISLRKGRVTLIERTTP